MKRILSLTLSFLVCGSGLISRAAAPTAPPRAATDDAPRAEGIEITSPSKDETVRVSQYDVQVTVADEDVDDIMVAVYTKSSGQKPATARTLELKRSERGKKSFVVELEEGANRIEVSDLKRQGVIAKRTITYAPAADVLNSSAAAADRTPTGAAAEAGEPAATEATICGQIQLASLNRTLALIRATPELADLAARFRIKGDPLVTSTLRDDCTARGGQDGGQKEAVADLLKAVLMRLKPDLTPKDVEPNRIALRKQRANLLERTTSDSDIRALAEGIRSEGNEAQSRLLKGDERENDLTLTRGSEFNSLSADTIRKQINLLHQYLGNVEVLLTEGDNVHRTFTDRDGNFVFHVDPGTGVAAADAATAAKEYTVSTDADQHYTTRKVTVARGNRKRVNIDIEDRPVSLLARTIIGYDQSGAAAARHEQSFFLDFFVSKSFPFRQRINPDFGERLKIWGDFRINSVPQTGDVSVGDFAGGGFTTAVSGLKVKDVARVFEVLGGVEYRLTGNNALLPSFDRQTKQKFSLSLIGAYGIVTPLNPLEQSPTVFKVFENAEGLPPAAKGKEFVAFIPMDRDRFFRQYYAGLRVQTFFFNKYNVPIQRFPAQFDLTVGQNEFVTGGRMHGPVLRMESFFPLPYEKMKFINLFATAQMIPGRARIGTPLVLPEAPAGTTVPAANVALIGVPQPNRDHYRIGIGVDFIPFFQKLLQAKTSGTPAGSATPPANNVASGGDGPNSPNH